MEKKDKEDLKKSAKWTIILLLMFGSYIFGTFHHNKDCGGGVRQSDAEKLQLKADKFILNQKVGELNATIAQLKQNATDAESELKRKRQELDSALANIGKNKDAMVALEQQNRRIKAESEKKMAEANLISANLKNKEAKKAELEAAQKERDDRIKGKRYDAHGKTLVVGNITPGYRLRVFIPYDAKEPLVTLGWNEYRAFPYEGFDLVTVRVEKVRPGFDGGIEKESPSSFEPALDPKTEKYNGVWIYRLVDGVMLRTQDKNALPLQFNK